MTCEYRCSYAEPICCVIDTIILSPQVTADGELVHDLDSVHKKPYETLIIGRKSCGNSCLSSDKQGSLCNREENGLQSSASCDSSSCYVERTSEIGHSQSCSFAVSATSEENSTNSVCIDRLKCSSSEHGSAPSCKKRKVAEEGVSDGGCQGCSSCTCFEDIPHRFVFMCVPSAVHSQKPYLGGELEYHNCRYFWRQKTNLVNHRDFLKKLIYKFAFTVRVYYFELPNFTLYGISGIVHDSML